MRARCHLLFLSLLATLTPLARGAADGTDPRDAEIRALRELVNQLDQRVRALETGQTATTAPPQAAADHGSDSHLLVNDRGFALESADRDQSLRLHGLVQADYRWFVDDGGIDGNDTFLVRRARIALDGRLSRNVEFQVVPEFAASATTLLDANVNVIARPVLQVRAGRFKPPIGLEQLQSDPWTFFVERAYPSQLMPNRDIGFVVHGEFGGGTTAYAVGAFNGAADGAVGSLTDENDAKEIVGRVFFRPFKDGKDSIWSGLGFGLGASTGRHSGAAGLAASYRTDGLQTMYRYRANVVADGTSSRLAPQVSWSRGPMGFMAEYVESRAAVRLPTDNTATRLHHDAWQWAAAWMLTGEEISARGVTPRHPFDPAQGEWGAWQLTGRISQLEFDAQAFPLFADPAASAQRATTLGLGVNWYLTPALRATMDWFWTSFDFAPGATAAAASNPVLEQDEHAIVTRLGLTF